MSFDNFYIILVFSGIILGLLSSNILLFANKAHKHANRLLALSTLILVLNITTNALLKTEFYPNNPHFFRVTSPLLYMYSPLVYLYIRAMIKDETGFRKWDWINFVPAILHFCELLPFYTLSSTEKTDFINNVISDPSKLNHFASHMLSPYVHNIIKASMGLFYMLLALRMLKLNKAAISKRSPDQNKNIYRWLITLATTILIMVILILLFFFMPIEDGLDINILMTLTVLVIYFLCIYLFFVPSILFGLPIVRSDLIMNRLSEVPNPAYSLTIANQTFSTLGSGNVAHTKIHLADKGTGIEETNPVTLDSDRYAYLEAYKPLLEMHLESAKPYLKTGYSINDLSAETGIPLHHLSALLNKGYNERFNDFINKLRLEYLANSFKPEWKLLTLEGIGKEVGFNSRTTFYNAIKKNTGLSPSVFFENRKIAFEKA